MVQPRATAEEERSFPLSLCVIANVANSRGDLR